MPQKLRQIKADLRAAKFVERRRRGKGSYSWWVHPLAPEFPVNLAGGDGDDGRPYQEQQARDALAAVAQASGKAGRGDRER
jgi:hypothetical protein